MQVLTEEGRRRVNGYSRDRRDGNHPEECAPGPSDGARSRRHRPAWAPRAGRYFTGIIRCWYGVPGHIT